MPRSLPLLLALAACAGVKHDDAVVDSDTTVVADDSEPTYAPDTYDTSRDVVDTVVVDSDVHTGDTGDGYFRPTQVSYGAELGIDATPALHDYSVLRTLYQSTFVIVLSDGVADCRIDYVLSPGALGWAGQEGGDPGLADFLQRQGQLFGLKIAPGLYTATTSAVCDQLPPIYTDLPADVLSLFAGGNPVLYVGVDQAPEASVVTSITTWFPWIAAENVLGGRMEFPFLFSTQTAAVTNWFSTGGVMGVVDESFGIVPSTTGFVLHPIADAWTGSQPGLGYYWIIPPLGFRLTWSSGGTGTP